VAQVRFTEWTRDGNLRHADFLGLRQDKKAHEGGVEIHNSRFTTSMIAGKQKGQNHVVLAFGDKVVYAVTTALRRAARPTFFAVRTSLQARPFCQP
jgi:hypothetical protein